jgi:hypothetical protein
VASLVVAAVFGWAAAAKVTRPAAWRRALEAYRLPAPLRALATWTVPAAEAAVPVAILAGSVAVGAGVALTLLLAFSGAVLWARRGRADRLPCGCFGRGSSRSVRLLLARNVGLAALAWIAARSGGAGPSLPPIGMPDALPILLAAVGTALAAVVVTQSARVHRRARLPRTPG